MTESFTWTPDLVNQAMTTKQKKLSEVMTFKPTLEEEFDTAKMKFEMAKSRLSLKYEFDNGERISDNKIKAKVRTTDEYTELWAAYIVAKSKMRKAKMEIAVLEREMKTLENINMSLMSEAKSLRYNQGTDGMGNTR